MGKQTAATKSRLTYPAQHSKQIILSTMSSSLITTQAWPWATNVKYYENNEPNFTRLGHHFCRCNVLLSIRKLVM